MKVDEKKFKEFIEFIFGCCGVDEVMDDIMEKGTELGYFIQKEVTQEELDNGDAPYCCDEEGDRYWNINEKLFEEIK